MKEQPKMDEYQEAYIELIARKTAKAVSDDLEQRLIRHLETANKERDDIDKRLQKVERKMFNGINLKINLLYGFYVAMLGILIKLAFFGH